MKHIVIIVFLVLSTSIFSQNNEHILPYKLNLDTHKMFLQKTFYDSTRTKSDLFKANTLWFAKEIKAQYEIDILYSDSSKGEIISEGFVSYRFHMLTGSEDFVFFNIKIFIKEGKTKIVIDEIKHRKIGTLSLFSKPKPIEEFYYKNGDFHNKEKKNNRKLKSKLAKPLIDLLNSWEEYMNKTKENYNNF